MAHFSAPDLAGLMHGVAGLRDVPHAAAPASLLAAAAARAACVVATFTPKARSAAGGAAGARRPPAGLVPDRAAGVGFGPGAARPAALGHQAVMASALSRLPCAVPGTSG